MKEKTSVHHTKNIINILVGKCSKLYNTKNICKVYLNQNEATYYANKYKGVVHCVTSADFEDITNNDDVFVKNLFNNDIEPTYGTLKAYLVVCESNRINE